MERGAHVRTPQQRLDLGRDRTVRREHGVELVAVLHEVVRHRHDDLALQPLGVLVHGRDRRVGVHREDHDRRVARPRVVARVQVRDPVAPLLVQLGDALLRLVDGPRAEQHFVPDARRAARPGRCPRDRSPPRSQFASADRTRQLANPPNRRQQTRGHSQCAASVTPVRVSTRCSRRRRGRAARRRGRCAPRSGTRRRGGARSPSRDRPGVTNTGLSPGCDCRSSRRRCTRSSVSTPALTRSVSGWAPSMLISGRLISIAISLGVSSRPSTRALISDDRVGVEQLAVLQHRLREHHHLDRGGEVLEHERGHEVAALGVLAL